MAKKRKYHDLDDKKKTGNSLEPKVVATPAVAAAEVAKGQRFWKRNGGGDNPLARARAVVVSHKAQELWNKKLGAGYHLFLQYYSKQLASYLLLLQNDVDVSSDYYYIDASSSIRPVVVKQCGLSRASKKRRRRQQQQQQERKSQQQANNEQGKSCTMESLNTTTSLLDPSSHDPGPMIRPPFLSPNGSGRLWQAFHHYCDQKSKELLLSLSSSKNMRLLQPLVRALSSPLPLTFRIRRGWADPEYTTRLQHEIQQRFGQLVERAPILDDENNFIYRAKSSGVATVLCKDNLAKIAPDLKAWLLENAKFIARQELGSMLPVLFLAQGNSKKTAAQDWKKSAWIRPGCRVLDLCASPGSKTLQALELIGSSGKIKANDINPTRLQNLREAIQRADLVNSHRVQFFNVDASQFPIPSHQDKLYDCILCDVPCSGDGTIRKDAHILPNWRPQTANALHSLQVRIVVRALQCLKIGGVLCYSTCSLNPVENEAVVAAALVQLQRLKRPISAKLVSCPEFPNLKLQPGMTQWSVADYGHNDDNQQQHDDDDDDSEDDDEIPMLRWHASYSDACVAQMKHAVPSLWPPSENMVGLEQCRRLWPPDQDTGGFFLALIQRTA